MSGFTLNPLLPSRPSLHSLVAYWHPQLLIAAQVNPSDQGLGLKVTNAPEVGGCVIKEVAEFCSATQQLKPGDWSVFKIYFQLLNLRIIFAMPQYITV